MTHRGHKGSLGCHDDAARDAERKGREGQREAEIRKGSMCERVGFMPERLRTRQMEDRALMNGAHTHFTDSGLERVNSVCVCALGEK